MQVDKHKPNAIAIGLLLFSKRLFSLKFCIMLSTRKNRCSLVGGPGSAKFDFVGLNKATGNIKTFHIKTAKELSKKPQIKLVINNP